MKKVKYQKILKTRAKPDSKIEKWKAEQRKLAMAIVILEDKELLKLLAR